MEIYQVWSLEVWRCGGVEVWRCGGVPEDQSWLDKIMDMTEGLEKEKPLWRFCQFNNTINLHLDPGVESGIKIMDGRWSSHFTLRVRWNELEVNEGSAHKPEERIDKPILCYSLSLVTWYLSSFFPTTHSSTLQYVFLRLGSLLDTFKFI